MPSLPPKPAEGQPVSAALISRIIDYCRAITLQSSHGLRVSIQPGGTTAVPRLAAPTPTTRSRDEGFDTALLGIEIDNDAGQVKVLARRIKRHQPPNDATTPLIAWMFDQVMPLGDAHPDGVGLATIWLRYTLRPFPGEITVAWGAEPDQQNSDTGVRLYILRITDIEQPDPENPEGDPLIRRSATVARFLRPGDVDIEPMWLDYIEEPS